MQFLYTRNRWFYREGTEPTLDFCLWVLQVDGLRVPPFDQHPDGDGSLRALGMTAADWRVWFLRAVDPTQRSQDVKRLQQQALVEYMHSANIPDLEQLRQRYRARHREDTYDPPLPPAPEFRFYHASWQGSDAVRSRLVELQGEYQQVSTQHERLCMNVSRALDKAELRSKTRLYDEVRRYQSRIPPLHIHFVAYDYPLDYVVPPATLLITMQEGQPDPGEYRERVLAAVAELAARPGKQRKTSSYVRVEEQPGQSTAYRKHVRNPTPSPPPRQEKPQLSDPDRQALVEHLGDESLPYGLLDWTTLSFLRGKQRPGWKLYEVTFTELDGEQHRMIFILEQQEDGSWQCHGGGSSTDIQQEWFTIVAPVHDHPLLFLSANWINPGSRPYLLTAYGHVIDNGFDVERVRLRNEAGQALEDIVEDGFVFFACQPEEQVQLPMDAELYDHQGKLVWQQTIPETGLRPADKALAHHLKASIFPS